jgi:hypothetical protein
MEGEISAEVVESAVPKGIVVELGCNELTFPTFRKMRLSLLVGRDYRDYHNFFFLSDNH